MPMARTRNRASTAAVRRPPRGGDQRTNVAVRPQQPADMTRRGAGVWYPRPVHAGRIVRRNAGAVGVDPHCPVHGSAMPTSYGPSAGPYGPRFAGYAGYAGYALTRYGGADNAGNGAALQASAQGGAGRDGGLFGVEVCTSTRLTRANWARRVRDQLSTLRNLGANLQSIASAYETDTCVKKGELGGSGAAMEVISNMRALAGGVSNRTVSQVINDLTQIESSINSLSI